VAVYSRASAAAVHAGRRAAGNGCHTARERGWIQTDHIVAAASDRATPEAQGKPVHATCQLHSCARTSRTLVARGYLAT
jgi:hypothetical protein